MIVAAVRKTVICWRSSKQASSGSLSERLANPANPHEKRILDLAGDESGKSHHFSEMLGSAGMFEQAIAPPLVRGASLAHGCFSSNER